LLPFLALNKLLKARCPNQKMKLLKDLSTNILILVVIGFVLYLIMPDMMKAMLEILGVWGPGIKYSESE
jgi:hypothetical protein